MDERWHAIILSNRDVEAPPPGVDWREPDGVLAIVRDDLAYNLVGAERAERIERDFPAIFAEFLRKRPESEEARTARHSVLLAVVVGAVGAYHGQADTSPNTIRAILTRWGQHDAALVDWAMGLYGEGLGK